VVVVVVVVVVIVSDTRFPPIQSVFTCVTECVSRVLYHMKVLQRGDITRVVKGKSRRYLGLAFFFLGLLFCTLLTAVSTISLQRRRGVGHEKGHMHV